MAKPAPISPQPDFPSPFPGAVNATGTSSKPRIFAEGLQQGPSPSQSAWVQNVSLQLNPASPKSLTRLQQRLYPCAQALLPTQSSRGIPWNPMESCTIPGNPKQSSHAIMPCNPMESHTIPCSSNAIPCSPKQPSHGDT